MNKTELAQLIEAFNEDHDEASSQFDNLRQALDQISLGERDKAESARITLNRVAQFMETQVELHLKQEEELLFNNPIFAHLELSDILLTEHREIRGRIARFRLMMSRLGSVDQVANQRIQGLLRTAALDLASFLEDHANLETWNIFPLLLKNLQDSAPEQERRHAS